MEHIVDKLRYQQHRNSTKSNYYGVWKSFNQFYIKLDKKHKSWEDRLILFVAYLIDTGKKSTTIHSYISAIRAVLRNEGCMLNDNNVMLSALTRVCKLHYDTFKVRLPIRKSLLNILLVSIKKLFKKNPQPYLECMYETIFLTGYYGLFRIGELTESNHVLLANDVHIGRNKNKLMFILWSSKTHTEGDKPQIIKIDALPGYNKTHWDFCPFKMLTKYLQFRKPMKTDNEQFFVFKDRSPVKPKHVRMILKKLLLINNFNPAPYVFHGIRAGRATDLMESGVSIETIKKLGRWRSSSIFTYLRS